MIYRTREGESVRNGINLDWWHSSTIFRLIIDIPFYRSHKFYKGMDFISKNLCLMRDEYVLRFYFRIRRPFIFKTNYKPFIIEVETYTRPYYSKVIATREQLMDKNYA